MALNITEKRSDGVVVLALYGQIKLGDESNKLRSHIKDVLAAEAKQLVLDLAGVNYIDSAGLGTLVSGYSTSRNQGATMKLANLTNKVHEQLQITKLVTVFDVHGSVEEAVKSFGG